MLDLRFYIVNAGGYVSIIDYMSYRNIALLDLNKSEEKKEAKRLIKLLSDLTDLDYLSYISKTVKGLKKIDIVDREKDKEDWIEGAWLQVTDKTLKELGLKDIKHTFDSSLLIVLNAYNERLHLEKQVEARKSIESNILPRRALKSKHTSNNIQRVTKGNRPPRRLSEEARNEIVATEENTTKKKTKRLKRR